MIGWPITNYGVAQVKKYSIIISAAIIAILLVGNIIGAIIVDEIIIDPKFYKLKEGYPFFTSAGDYINLVRSYQYDFGTKISIYKMRRGESFWDVAIRNNITIETIIAANPFLTSLIAREDTEIVVPCENGVLFAFDNLIDVWRMSGSLDYNDEIKGNYIHNPFRLFSLDDIRFAFYKNSAPAIVNNHLEDLYRIKKIFQSPIEGYYTSMYGTRVDPFLGWLRFHNGIDIKTSRGTPIYPAREGFVSSAGWMGQLGLALTVLHREGYETIYGHCASINVKPGDWVSKEDVIGTVGTTGRVTGPHLHFTIKRHGMLLDPLLFIW